MLQSGESHGNWEAQGGTWIAAGYISGDKLNEKLFIIVVLAQIKFS